MAEKWIQGAIKHPGALRKELKIKSGQKIPTAKLKKAEHSKNPTTAKRARLAETLKSFHHSNEDKKMYGSSKKASPKLNKMEKDLQHEKKPHKDLMSSLNNHFKGEEKHERDEEEMEGKSERKAPKSEAHKKMDKNSRKTLAITIMKKKMKG